MKAIYVSKYMKSIIDKSTGQYSVSIVLGKKKMYFILS